MPAQTDLITRFQVDLEEAVAAREAGSTLERNELGRPGALELLDDLPVVELVSAWLIPMNTAVAGVRNTGRALELRVDGERCFVREVEGVTSQDRFVTSANARIRKKADGHGRTWLAVAAPAHLFEKVAELVAAIDAAGDGLGRRVVKNARWTMNTAPQFLEQYGGERRASELEQIRDVLDTVARSAGVNHYRGGSL